MSTPATTRPDRAPPPARRRARRPRRERAGMAIILVLTAVAICMVIVNEFGTRTSIDMLQARNNLDQMRAHYLARSSVHITDLILRLQRRLDNVPQLEGMGISLPMFAPNLMDAFGGDPEAVEAAIGMPMEDLKGMGGGVGNFSVEIKPIEGKINVNCAAASAPRDRKIVYGAITALIFPKLYDPVFEEEDAEGWRRDRKTQVEAIMDYIDTNTDRYETPGAPEDYRYEGLRDPYKAKNAALDSISELKLVRGVDDRFWTLFGDAFRVGSTSDCKVNLRSFDNLDVIIGLIVVAGEKDPVVASRPDVAVEVARAIGQLAIQAQGMGQGFATAQEFAAFVKDPNAYLLGAAGDGASGGAAPAPAAPTATPATQAVVLPYNITGIELDVAILREMVDDRDVRFYEVIATGEIARGGPLRPLKRTIRATYDAGYTLQTSRVMEKLPTRNNGRQGAWLYLREE